jgi:hypothetical protein
VPAEHQGFHLHWSAWRRAHQAVARRGHIAARARARPVLTIPEQDTQPTGPEAHPLPVELSDARWARVRPLLPPPAPAGRPARDARTVLTGVLWILGSHASWRELPAEYGPWQTAYRRYRAWCATGAWPRLLQAPSVPAPPEAEVSL